MVLLPLYSFRADAEDYILCDMPLAKCNALAHSLADQNGTATVWADEDTEDQAAILQQAREIMRNNYLFREP